MKLILTITSLVSAMLAVMSVIIMVFGLISNEYAIAITYAVATIVWFFLTVTTGYAQRQF